MVNEWLILNENKISIKAETKYDSPNTNQGHYVMAPLYTKAFIWNYPCTKLFELSEAMQT